MSNLLGFRRENQALLLLALALLLLCSPECWGQGPPKVILDGNAPRKINLEVGKSVIIRSSVPISQATVAKPEIADIVDLRSPHQIYVTAKAPGMTNLTLWQNPEKVSVVYDIEVAPDVTRLREKLYQLIPNEKSIEVLTSHDAITVAGTVSSTAALSRALALAEAYAPDKKVVNLLEVAGVHQVMLEVRVAEVSRSLLSRLGINFIIGKQGSVGASLLNNIATLDEFSASDLGASLDLKFSPSLNALFHIIDGSMTWTAFLDALKEDGHVRILAEPTLVALSGQTASFLAGGEFPVPVPQGLGTVAIEYKPFGVGLLFTPTVLSNERIHLQISPEVSELDFTTALAISGFVVPGLSTRKATTSVELADGQSFAIAGLLKDTSRKAISRLPILGEIPVLGTLFRSSAYQNNETELVIIATPHLAKPLDMAKQSLPTDNYREPTDAEFFLLGLTEGREKRDASALPFFPSYVNDKGGMEGDFGHSIPR